MNKRRALFAFVFLALMMGGCKKFLDKKPSDRLVTPSYLSDLQGLLDNGQMNIFGYAAEMLCDDYYLLDVDWSAFYNNTLETFVIQKYLSHWENTDNTNDYWNGLYQNVLTTNIVLDELSNMKNSPDSLAEYNNIKGSALFFRAYYFYHLAQSFTKSYVLSTAATDPGIVLRLSGDVNELSIRSSVKETYEQIINDFKKSIRLLPLVAAINSRPSQAAAYGALARTYLMMGDFTSSLKYADSCLSLSNSLMDYNQLVPSSNIPFSRFNSEVIFSARSTPIVTILGTRAKIDSNLYKSYTESDLRKQLFFKPAATGGGFQFKGDYYGIGLAGNNNNTFFSFTGIVTDELYLIKAECHARKNDVDSAMGVLNALLVKRYKAGTFVPLTATANEEALAIILVERRKELLHRGTRWSDIKRLIQDPVFRILPERRINNITYSMIKGDQPYLMQIPLNVIKLSGILQNKNGMP